MIKKLFTLFKLGRKLAKSDILNIVSKFKKPPLSIKILFKILYTPRKLFWWTFTRVYVFAYNSWWYCCRGFWRYDSFWARLFWGSFPRAPRIDFLWFFSFRGYLCFRLDSMCGPYSFRNPYSGRFRQNDFSRNESSIFLRCWFRTSVNFYCNTMQQLTQGWIILENTTRQGVGPNPSRAFSVFPFH